MRPRCAPQHKRRPMTDRMGPEEGLRMNDDRQLPTKTQELRAFLFLTIVTAPVLAVVVVGGYGFFVWMYQLFTGTLPSG